MATVRALGRSAAWLAVLLVLAATVSAPGGLLSWFGTADASPALRITGSIAGLEPGRPGILHLVLENSADDVAVVRILTVDVTRAPASCSASSLRITPWRGRLLVPAQGTAVAEVAMSLMSRAAGCSGVTWELAYAAS